MQAHPRRRPAIAGVVAEGFPTRKFVAATDAGRPGPKLVASASRFWGLGCPKILHEVRTPGATARRPGARGLRGPVSGPTPPAYRLRGTVPGHHRGRVGSSSRSHRGGARAQRGSGHLRSQPSVGRQGAEPGGQGANAAVRDTLDLIEVRVLDHIVVGGAETISPAERGLL